MTSLFLSTVSSYTQQHRQRHLMVHDVVYCNRHSTNTAFYSRLAVGSGGALQLEMDGAQTELLECS